MREAYIATSTRARGEATPPGIRTLPTDIRERDARRHAAVRAGESNGGKLLQVAPVLALG